MGIEFLFTVQILRKEANYLQGKKDIHEMRKEHFETRETEIKICELKKAIKILKERVP